MKTWNVMITIKICYTGVVQDKQREGKVPKRRRKNQWHTHSQTQESHNKPTFALIIYVQRTLCQPVWVLNLLLQSEFIQSLLLLTERACFLVVLQPLLAVTLFMPPLPWGFLSPQGRDLVNITNVGLSVSSSLSLLMSGCGSLYLFPSPAGGIFFGDGWAKCWSVNMTKCH